MKNSKGFTLVELMVIIIFLAALSSVVYMSVTGIIERQKEKTFTESVNAIIESTIIYATDHAYSFDVDGTNIYVDSKTNNYYIDITSGIIPMSQSNQIISGHVYIEDNIIYVSNIYDGRYCAKSGTTNSLEIVKGEC